MSDTRLARKINVSTFDRIFEYYFSKKVVKLSTKEEEIRTRWDFAWKILNGMYSQRQAALAVAKKFEVSEREAFDDVKQTLRLFNDPKNANKEAKRAIAEEWIVRGIKKAWDDQDLDAYERLLRRYAKINKLEGDDVENFVDRPAIVINFNADVETLKKQQEELRRKAVEANAEDIEFQST